MTDTSKKKLNLFDYIFLILCIILFIIFSIIFSVPLIFPIKESISCVNKNCEIKDYSFLYTTVSRYNLSDVHLGIQTDFRPASILLTPISKCSYSILYKAEDDIDKLTSQDNVVTKHVSSQMLVWLGIEIYLLLQIYLVWRKVFRKEKFTKYIIIAIMLRLLYILII